MVTRDERIRRFRRGAMRKIPTENRPAKSVGGYLGGDISHGDSALCVRIAHASARRPSPRDKEPFFSVRDVGESTLSERG